MIRLFLVGLITGTGNYQKHPYTAAVLQTSLMVIICTMLGLFFGQVIGSTRLPITASTAHYLQIQTVTATCIVCALIARSGLLKQTRWHQILKLLPLTCRQINAVLLLPNLIISICVIGLILPSILAVSDSFGMIRLSTLGMIGWGAFVGFAMSFTTEYYRSSHKYLWLLGYIGGQFLVIRYLPANIALWTILTQTILLAALFVIKFHMSEAKPLANQAKLLTLPPQSWFLSKCTNTKAIMSSTITALCVTLLFSLLAPDFLLPTTSLFVLLFVGITFSADFRGISAKTGFDIRGLKGARHYITQLFVTSLVLGLGVCMPLFIKLSHLGQLEMSHLATIVAAISLGMLLGVSTALSPKSIALQIAAIILASGSCYALGAHMPAAPLTYMGFLAATTIICLGISFFWERKRNNFIWN